jgi:ankyrin repeat protein
MLKLGADINAKDKYDFTSLHYAVLRDDDSFLKILLSEVKRISKSNKEMIKLKVNYFY